MKKIKNILKIFAFMFIIKASFLVSFAFLGDDLGLDLYKKIDKGVNSLENKQYSYELKGGIEGGTITEKVNRILESDGLGHCKVKNLSEEDVDKISAGDIALLSEKLEGKCGTIEELTKVKEKINDFKLDTKDKAKEKTKQIQKISKIGLYSDGSIKNSPFDIIYDIKEIDQIVFTQKVEYKGERGIGDDELGDYLKGKLNDFENDADKKINDELEDLNELTGKILNKEKDKELKDGNHNFGNNNTNSGYIDIIGDNTQYSCPINESGLSDDDLKEILNGNNGESTISNNSIDENGIINKNYVPYNPGTFGFSTGKNGYGKNGEIKTPGANYVGVNDNSVWGCNTFFCITVEFITHNAGLVGGSQTTMSIQALLERSNGHLKKFANSSLIQSKMATNNFELSLRDLDLSEIFSFGMVVTKKTPPILDLQGLNDEVGKKKDGEDNNPLSQKNLLKARFDAIGINIKRENDLSIYFDRIGDEKSTANSAELSINNVSRNYTSRKEFKESLDGLDLHIENVINSESNASDTDQLYQEFLELERFASEVQAYSNDLYKIVSKMVEIPIHP